MGNEKDSFFNNDFDDTLRMCLYPKGEFIEPS